MLSRRLRAAVAAALTVAGLTLPATVLTAPAHAIPVRCATGRAAVADAAETAATARGALADAKRALADAIAARRANPNPETRKGYTDALDARIAARGALNDATDAVKDAIAARNACLNAPAIVGKSYVGPIPDAEGDFWVIADQKVINLAPNQSVDVTVSLIQSDGRVYTGTNQYTASADGEVLVTEFFSFTGCGQTGPTRLVSMPVSVSAGDQLLAARVFDNPCPLP